MIWMTNNNMPIDHKPTTEGISTTKSPPEELFLSALTKNKFTT